MDRAFGILFSLQRGTPRHEQWVVQCLDGSWDRIVGKKLASVCRPVRVRGSELSVEVLDDAWTAPIRSVRSELQEKLFSATCGEIKKLKFSSPQPRM